MKLVGPLPAEVQNYTSYEAARTTGATSPEAVKAVLKQMATPAAKAAFAAGGME